MSRKERLGEGMRLVKLGNDMKRLLTNGSTKNKARWK